MSRWMPIQHQQTMQRIETETKMLKKEPWQKKVQRDPLSSDVDEWPMLIISNPKTIHQLLLEEKMVDLVHIFPNESLFGVRPFLCHIFDNFIKNNTNNKSKTMSGLNGGHKYNFMGDFCQVVTMGVVN